MRVTLEADHHRLYFDRPSDAGPDGPCKSLYFTDDTQQTVRMAIFTPRGDHRGAHNLHVTLHDEEGESTGSIPIEVINAAAAQEPSRFEIARDLRRDRAGFRWFTDSRSRVASAAANHWAYFIGDMGLDPVASGDELTFVWDHPRGFHEGSGSEIRSNFDYTEFLVHIYGIRCEGDSGTSCTTGELRSGGQPMARNSGQVQTRNGTPLQPRLWRSGFVDIEIDCNYDRDGWFDEVDESRWYELDTHAYENDLYSVVMHEMGHALAFNHQYEAFTPGSVLDSPAITAYYGGPVSIDDSHHFCDAVDPLSRYGAFGNDYHAEMPRGRWLITKLDLLLLEAVGYTMRDVAALREMSITTEEIPPYTAGESYHVRLEVEDGLPPYHWSGILPRGLSIDSFTGEITGTLAGDASRIGFPVEVCDQDPTSGCDSRRFELFREGPPAGNGDDDDNGNGDEDEPAPLCPPGQICAEPAQEPGECHLCIPEGADRP